MCTVEGERIDMLLSKAPYTISSVAFPGNRTHDLSVASAVIFCSRNVCRLLTWGGVCGSEMLSTSDGRRHGDRLTSRDRFWLAISRFAGSRKPADEMTAHFHSTWDLSLHHDCSDLTHTHALKSDWSEDGRKIDWKEETDRVKWDPAEIRSSTSGAWVITMETGPFPCALWGALCPWRPTVVSQHNNMSTEWEIMAVFTYFWAELLVSRKPLS